MGMNGIPATSLRGAGAALHATPVAQRASSPSTLFGLPQFEGLGLEAVAAMLAAESAQQTASTMRKLERSMKEQQAAAIERQVSEMREKAQAIRSEGLVSGIMTTAAGAIQVGSSVATVGALARETQWSVAAGAKDASSFTKLGAARVHAAFQEQAAIADAVRTAGGTVGSLGPILGKATFGAEQIEHEASANQAAAEAKFAEAAKDEYASLAREAKECVQKAFQALQSFAAERQMTMRAILRAG